MPFWRRDPFEMAFWQDGTTRDILLTIDRSQWALAFLNGVGGLVCVGRFMQPSTQVIWWAVISIFWAASVAVAVAIRRSPNEYYRHRWMVVLANRMVRIVWYPIMLLFLDKEAMKSDLLDKVARGRHPGRVVFWILTQGSGNDLPWGLYYPLPFRQSIWLDIAQEAMRLMVRVMHCAQLLAHPSLKPTVSSLCKVMNTYFSNDLLLPVTSQQMSSFDLACVEDGPLLLSIFVWWFCGCFLPTFTLWYFEFVLKKRFMIRQQGNAGEQQGIWDWTWPYLWIIYVVGSSTWLVLQVLLDHKATKDVLVRFLMASPW